MKLLTLTLFLLISLDAFSKTGSDLLLKRKTERSTVIKRQRKVLDLSDPFLIQVFGKMKSLNVKNEKLKEILNLLLGKKFDNALSQVSELEGLSYAELRLLNCVKLYLFFKKSFAQSFFNLWTSETVNHKLLESELGVSLDQVVGDAAARWILKSGITYTEQQKTELLKIQNFDNQYNLAVQSLLRLKAKSKALEILVHLKLDDPFVFPLAKTIIVDYAREGKLSEAASIIKTYLEPNIARIEDIDRVSSYYILLARLLYQAKAYPQAKDYYFKVPDESRHFLSARLEALWISTRENDLSMILGEVKSLSFFKEEFLPERYLVEAMANLKLCRFKNVQESINKFVTTNRKFSKLIDKNLRVDNPMAFPSENFYRSYFYRTQQSLHNEIKSLDKFDLKEKSVLVSQLKIVKKQYVDEIKLEWRNKEKLIENALQKMRFVKVEYLSTMRRLTNRMAQSNESDKVSTISSAVKKKDSLEFPYDGVTFGDELFNLYSRAQKLCLGERK